MYAHLTAHPAHTANRLHDGHHAARRAELAALAAEIEQTEGLPPALACARASAALDRLLEEAESWDALAAAQRRAREGR